MNGRSLLANPTGNGMFCIVPLYSFMPWFLFIMSILFTLGLVFGGGQGSVLVFAPVFPNLMMAMVLGNAVRDQMNCPMTLCLPNHQQGFQHHLLALGLLLNFLIACLVLLSPVQGVSEKSVLALFSLILGLCVFLAVVNYMLVAENMAIFQVFFPVCFVIFSTSFESMAFIGEHMLKGFAGFVLLLVLLSYQFWTTMNAPGLSRTLMSMPGTDTGFGGNINDMTELETSRQAWFYRKRQHWPVYHWIANLRLPFRSTYAEHMLMVLKRSLELMLRPEFWILFILLAFIHPWVVIQKDHNMVLAGYPIILFLYMITIVTPTDVSPFLPYSRMSRIGGLFLVNIFALLLFFLFVSATYFFYQLLTEPGGDYFVYSFWRLAFSILLYVPFVLLMQLVMGLIRNHIVLVMILAMLVMMVISFSVIANMQVEVMQDAGVVFGWLIGGMAFYLVCLYGRYRIGSLSVL